MLKLMNHANASLTMIPQTIEIEFEGRQYLWGFDSTDPRPSECWDWSEVKTSMTHPDSKIGILNRKFITEKAEAIAEALTSEPQAEICNFFYRILESMDARDSDFATPALQHILAFRARSPGQRSLPRGLPPHSPLNLLGYQAGKDCPVCVTRHSILRKAFEGELPLVELPPDELDAYMRRWGDPGSEKRLETIAKHIANWCEVFKWSRLHKEAIYNRRSDLRWLKENIYDKESFTFGWPVTAD